MSISLEFTGEYDATQRNFDKLGPAVFAPVPQARVYSNANISVANNTATALTFNSERYDEGALHSTSSNTGRLTAPVAGLYQVGCCVEFGVASGGIRSVAIRLNGTTTIAIDHRAADSGGTGLRLPVTAQWQMAAGDYAEVVVSQTSGGALNVVAASAYSPEFWMVRLAGFTAQVFD